MPNLFNPFWWKYFWQADTQYQVHSPFLFDFVSNIWPLKSNELIKQNTKLTTDNESTFTWLFLFCTHYEIKQLILPHGSDLANSLLEKNYISSSPDIPQKFKFLSWYQIYISKNHSSSSHIKPFFSAIGILSIEQLNAGTVNAISSRSDSFLLICNNIHQDKGKYHRWNQIIISGEFHFSIELYNFGVLFHYPVNQKPEHIILIPWKWKPWKIRTI